MKKKSLGFKLVVGVVLTVVIPIIIIGAFSVSKASVALENLAEEQVINIAKNLADMTNLALIEELKNIGVKSGEIDKNVGLLQIQFHLLMYVVDYIHFTLKNAFENGTITDNDVSYLTQNILNILKKTN